MKRLIAPISVIAAAVVLSACGGGGGSAGSGSGSGSAAGTDTGPVKQLSGVGSVLVDKSGMATYTPDQEANGKIVCTSGCTAFWMPVTPTGGAPTPVPGAGKLGTVTRPDGTMQVTDNGKPLYTFA